MVHVPFPADDACLILTETFTEQFHSTVKVEPPYEAGLSHDLVSFLSGPSTPSDYGGGGVKFRSFVGPLRVGLGDHPKAAIDDQVKSGHREKA
jgi:hypothetical protein